MPTKVITFQKQKAPGSEGSRAMPRTVWGTATPTICGASRRREQAGRRLQGPVEHRNPGGGDWQQPSMESRAGTATTGGLQVTPQTQAQTFPTPGSLHSGLPSPGPAPGALQSLLPAPQSPARPRSASAPVSDSQPGPAPRGAAEGSARWPRFRRPDGNVTSALFRAAVRRRVPVPVPKMVAGPSTAVTNGGEAGANPELPDSAMAAGGVASGGPSLPVGLAGRRRRQLTGAPPPSPLPTARLVPRRTVDPSSRPCKAPGPLWGMDQGKMDENEWGYHGEGNKSLVVAHAQVSDGRRRARDPHPARPFPRPPSTPRCGSGAAPPRPLPVSPQLSSASPESHLPPRVSFRPHFVAPPPGRRSVPPSPRRRVGAAFLQGASPPSGQLRVPAASPALPRELPITPVSPSPGPVPRAPGRCGPRVRGAGGERVGAVDLPPAPGSGAPVAAPLQLLIVEHCPYAFCRIFQN